MKTSFLLFLFACFSQFAMNADEGMWPLNMVPQKQIEKTYGVKLSPDWIEHVQRSSLRLSTGGSSAFVSPHGLVMTNHHVGSKAIYNLSTESQDLLKNGFYAASIEHELKCSNLYADQLISIQDVTDVIKQSFSADLSLVEREKARKEAINQLSKKVREQTGFEPQVVSLYQGARYHLYLYKRYTDIRLVMAPEKAIAFFGGDAENFEYPRHCLDVCFFRIYENNQPLVTKDFFTWNRSGPKVEEPLFVVGHPGGTDRKLTSGHLAHYKDHGFPFIKRLIEEKVECLQRFSQQSEENARIASQDLFSLQNSLKVYKAKVSGLQTTSIIKNRIAFEQKLFSDDEKEPLDRLQASFSELNKYYMALQVLEGAGSRHSKLFIWAKQLVRLSDELQKPNEKRLKEYSDTQMPLLELSLLSQEPVYLELERVMLADGLTRFEKVLGQEHDAVKAAFGSKSVEEIVSGLVAGTQLQDLQFRKTLYQNPQLVKTSEDPFIKLARALDPYSRAIRERYENEHESQEKESYTKIMDKIFERYGESLYPDATFTLRLSVGKMASYEECGNKIAVHTSFASLFESSKAHEGQDPYLLPKSWRERKECLNMATPFNFISTNDIIGGNSGSPVLNKDAEVVGLIFDGNKQAFFWNFEYEDLHGRAVSVHAQAILEALSKIYGADSLVTEITDSSLQK